MMRIRKKLHISYADLLFAFYHCLIPETQTKRKKRINDIKEIWSGSRNQASKQIFVGLSVRTCFDLYLSSLNLPEKSEVLISAMTIPNIIEIIEHHHLIPIPIDLDTETMSPKLELLEYAVSEKSRILMLTHLFGTRYDLDPYVKFAKKHQLLLVEDCAQAFSGIDGYTGHPETDISMFSFGMIKRSTALGGAVCTIRNRDIYDAMLEFEAHYPLYEKTAVFKKIWFSILIKAVTENPLLLGILIWGIEAFGFHYETVFTQSVRGFTGQNLFDKIRKRSSHVHLNLLKRRLQHAQGKFLMPAINKGKYADSRFNTNFERPGHKAVHNTYWLYPVIVSNPGRLIMAIRSHGFDATQGSTQLTWVPLPTELDEKRARRLDPHFARRLMEHVVFLPNYASLPQAQIDSMFTVCQKHAQPLHADGIHLKTGAQKGTTPLQFRNEKIECLKNTTYDLLIVGGGINGAGIAREAALQGLKVTLIEKNDYASGSSGKSANLIHGGFRYLESLQFKTVMECCTARYEQMKLNSHLVEPLAFILPVYAGSKGGINKLDFGLWLYDLLDRFRSYRFHKRMGKESTTKMVGSLKSEGMIGSLLYYDCLTDDSRLTLANIADAERNGAVALNHIEFVELISNSENKIQGASLFDSITKQPIRVKAKHIVFALGPDSNRIPGVKNLVAPTRGSHIVVRSERLNLKHAVAMMSPDDGRWCYCFPFYDTVVAGTTELPYENKDSQGLSITRQEVTYLLNALNSYFPQNKLTDSDVHCTWTGLRPLFSQEMEKRKSRFHVIKNRLADLANSSTNGSESREYRVLHNASGITTVISTKLTTYRLLSEKVVQQLCKHGVVKSDLLGQYPFTRNLPLDKKIMGISKPLCSKCSGKFLSDNRFKRYSSDLDWIEARIHAFSEERELIVEDLDLIMAEVSWAVIGEQALHLDDVMIRRLKIFYRDKNQGLGCSKKVANHMAMLLEENADWIENEVATYQHIVYLSRQWQTTTSN